MLTNENKTRLIRTAELQNPTSHLAKVKALAKNLDMTGRKISRNRFPTLIWTSCSTFRKQPTSWRTSTSHFHQAKSMMTVKFLKNLYKFTKITKKWDSWV